MFNTTALAIVVTLSLLIGATGFALTLNDSEKLDHKVSTMTNLSNTENGTVKWGANGVPQLQQIALNGTSL